MVVVTGTFTVRSFKLFCQRKVAYGLVDQGVVQTQFAVQTILIPLCG